MSARPIAFNGDIAGGVFCRLPFNGGRRMPAQLFMQLFTQLFTLRAAGHPVLFGALCGPITSGENRAKFCRSKAVWYAGRAKPGDVNDAATGAAHSSRFYPQSAASDPDARA